MIDLTPLEVRKKKGDFRRAMRGYDPQSVDDFLDVVADRLEALVRENAALLDRLSRVEDQVNDYRERERALTEALVTAQEMREQMRQQIEREAELKRREAEAAAESIRAEATQIREREEEAIRRLQARQAQFLQSYRAFLERELAELSAEMESLEIGRAATPAPAQPRARKQAPQPRAAQTPAPAAPPPPPAAPPVQAAAAAAAAVPQPAEPEAEPLPLLEEDVPPPPPPPRDKTFDELLNALPGFSSVTEEKQETTAEEAADLLADVRAEFDAIVAGQDLPIPEPEAMPEAGEVLDLVDDVADDEDEDGWMSMLLEGRGDDRSK